MMFPLSFLFGFLSALTRICRRKQHGRLRQAVSQVDDAGWIWLASNLTCQSCHEVSRLRIEPN
jgi:hypothetical protein